VRVLVLGSGGREHALAWKLAQEAEVLAFPGNPGMAEDGIPGYDLPINGLHDFEGIASACHDQGIDLAVVGPENPLIEGVGDFLRDRKITTFGPGASGAKLEGSKAFSKALMAESGVPTARFETFSDSAEAKAFARAMAESGTPPVVKASGNAMGKGVVVCSTIEEADEAIDMMLVDHELGDAGGTIVVEERLLGFEFSLLTICSENGYHSLPIAQDYKRALDGDRGPNTGGMGTYSPVAAVTPDMVREAECSSVKPMLDRLRSAEVPYRGVLFSGFMVSNGKCYCLEYNVRFGDPETQTVVRRIGPGLSNALFAAAKGEPIPEIPVLENAAVTVVLASAGYPGSYAKGATISIPSLGPKVKVFHAGTNLVDSKLVTNGGRVLAVSAAAESLEDARAEAYRACDLIQFQGKQYRRDVGASPV
jgi:phosphoribosylamine--glycine ligase